MASEKSLVEILKSYPTDKIANGYGEFYEELFRPIRHSVESVLEIGIAQGGSLRAWRDYFSNATIYGIDIEPQFVEGVLYEHSIKPFCFDASDADMLRSWSKDYQFDIVIDDSSHYDEDILNVYRVLCLEPKLYIIEDINPNHHPKTLEYFHQLAVEAIEASSNKYLLQVLFRPKMIVVDRTL